MNEVYILEFRKEDCDAEIFIFASRNSAKIFAEKLLKDNNIMPMFSRKWEKNEYDCEFWFISNDDVFVLYTSKVRGSKDNEKPVCLECGGALTQGTYKHQHRFNGFSIAHDFDVKICVDCKNPYLSLEDMLLIELQIANHLLDLNAVGQEHYLFVRKVLGLSASVFENLINDIKNNELDVKSYLKALVKAELDKSIKEKNGQNE